MRCLGAVAADADEEEEEDDDDDEEGSDGDPRRNGLAMSSDFFV